MVLTTMLTTGCGGSHLAEVFLEQVLVIPVSLAFPDIVSRPLIQIPKSLPGWWVAPGSPDRGGCLPSRHSGEGGGLSQLTCRLPGSSGEKVLVLWSLNAPLTRVGTASEQDPGGGRAEDASSAPRRVTFPEGHLVWLHLLDCNTVPTVAGSSGPSAPSSPPTVFSGPCPGWGRLGAS